MVEDNIKEMSKQLRAAVRAKSWSQVRQTQIGVELLEVMGEISTYIEENASLFQLGRKSLSRFDGDTMDVDDKIAHVTYDEESDNSPTDVWDEDTGTWVEDFGNIDFEKEWLKLGKVVLTFMKDLSKWVDKK